ncbi:MAG: DsrE family protein [Gammaproteobacteria bacterium]|jgi:uncharacterized protein
MKSLLLKASTAIAFALALVMTQSAVAADHSIADHKIVFQISSHNPAQQHLVLNNAVNIKKHWGDDVDVVVVAYGPGLSLFVPSKKNKEKARVASLAASGITFDACHNTMMAIKKKTGHLPKLINGVKVVPAGVARIVELEEKGYSYVKP